MGSLQEELGKFISEGNGKTRRKMRTRRRIQKADVDLARVIGSAMRARVHEIEKLLPMPWKISENFSLDKAGVEKFAEANMEGMISAEYDYQIGVHDRGGEIYNAEARIVISCIPEDDGNTVGCGVMIDEFDPSGRKNNSVNMSPGLRSGEIFVESEWRRKKDAFDPGRDLWPLIKEAMLKAKKKMPTYEEFGY